MEKALKSKNGYNFNLSSVFEESISELFTNFNIADLIPCYRELVKQGNNCDTTKTK